jgi:hypothetical protein
MSAVSSRGMRPCLNNFLSNRDFPISHGLQPRSQMEARLYSTGVRRSLYSRTLGTFLSLAEIHFSHDVLPSGPLTRVEGKQLNDGVSRFHRQDVRS